MTGPVKKLLSYIGEVCITLDLDKRQHIEDEWQDDIKQDCVSAVTAVIQSKTLVISLWQSRVSPE